MGHAPFNQLDKIVGNETTYFQKWLQHPIPDAYGEAMSPSIDDYKKMNLPILTITGHYDGDQPDAMTYYRNHMLYGSQEAKDKHYLIIGPWDHAGTRTPRREVGGLRFGPASMLDLNKLHKDWYDWTMKTGSKPEFLKKHIAYYVVGPGAENWKYADSLETISNTKRTLYLNSNGQANDIFQSGTMNDEKPATNLPSDKFVYDPLDKRPIELEKEPVENDLTDQRYVLNPNGNGLIYHSVPFAEATEITGYLKFVAWMAMDVPDTDFQVSVYEIQQDGTSILLTEDLMRARYRDSLKQEKLIKSGEISRYEFKSFLFFSRRVAKGSRLRLFIRCPNTPGLQKNYNSGGIVANETAKDARTAHITLYHNADYPSYLELPIVK